MKKSPLRFFVSMAVSFVAGAVAYALLAKPAPQLLTVAAPTLPGPKTSGAPTQSPSPPDTPGRGTRPAIAPNSEQASLVLRTDVVDAILAGGSEWKIFQRLGLTEEDRSQVARIRTERISAFKQLEAAHAKAVPDAQGGQIEIAPFPSERSEWLRSMEEDLRKQLGDDRAAVIARMIAFADNDEDIGIFRRELHVARPEEPGGKFKIEEKTFDANGDHVDSDDELLTDQSKSLWGHLLDFETGSGD